jgi:peptidoglycan/LPS O-acetylase OafA/YrhL
LAKLPYRPDIDGLRAIAVLSVVGFHLYPDRVPGGFIGVDIFFVISGYLISTIVFANLERESFSILEFYDRRIRRIFPALVTMMAAVLTLGWFGLCTDEYAQLGKHIAGGAAFVSNFMLWSESGYFDNAAETKPMLHLWTLAIEEQFYIFWPLLLAFVYRRNWSFLKLTAGIAAVSFLINIYLAGTNPTAAFFSPLSRFWELMIGGVLAYISLHKPSLIGSHKDIWSVVGFVMLAAALVFITQDNPFPGWWAPLPTIATFSIIAAGPEARLNRTLLANKPMIWIGILSYPIYLWHWPLISYLHMAGAINAKTKVAVVLITITLAWLTFSFVEKPFRSGPTGTKKAWVLLSAMAVLAAAGWMLNFSDGIPRRAFAMETNRFVEAKADWYYPTPEFSGGKIDTSSTHFEGSGPSSAIFMGDSLMAAYFPRAKAIYSGSGKKPAFSADFVAKPGCRLVPFGDRINSSGYQCDQYYTAAINLAKSPTYKAVVISENWGSVLSANVTAECRRKLPDDLAELKRLGKNIYIVRNPPRSDLSNPEYLAHAWPPVPTYVARSGLEIRERQTNVGLDGYLSDVTTRFIDPFDYLCSRDTCPIFQDDGIHPTHTDEAHLAASEAVKRAVFIDEIVR